MINVGLFVDGSNMFYAQKSNGWKIDYKKLYSYCQQSGKIAVAKYFVGFPYYIDTKSIETYRKFRSVLINIGYTVRDKEIRVRKAYYWNIEINGTPLDDLMRKKNKMFHTGEISITRGIKRDYKGNLDIEMAISMITESHHFEKCFLLSGDSDFIPVVRYLRQNNKYVICIAQKKTTSSDLVNEFNEFIDLSDIRSEIERK